MDGLQMLSARGPLVCDVFEEEEVTKVMLPGVSTVEVRGESFSAASRDPEQWRFADIDAYFDEGHRSEYPCSLCLRVTVRDQRTGRYGVLWEEGKETPRACTEDDLGPIVVSETQTIVGGLGHGVQCWTRFAIRPEPNQEGVAEEDRLYRVATGELFPGDGHHFNFKIYSTEIGQIRSMIRSLC
jgi:hypothetical protein